MARKVGKVGIHRSGAYARLMEENTLKQGDQVPGHVAVLIVEDASGKDVALQAMDLDRPFLGFFCDVSDYSKPRREVLPAEEFRRKYPGLEAR
jgi:hypothetical protein